MKFEGAFLIIKQICHLYLSWRKIFPKESHYDPLDKISICFFKMPYITFVRRWTRFFSCEFCKISYNTFFYRTSQGAASNYLMMANENKYFLSGLSYFGVFERFHFFERFDKPKL